MKTKTFKNEIVACAVALAGCVGIVGCQMNENGDASVAAEESADEAVVKGNIVSNVVEWLKPYQMKIPFVVENEGKDVYIRGNVGFFPALFSKYSIVIHLNAESQKAYCYGYLPTQVPAERRADMIEFLFRAECMYGLSPATLVLENDGMIRCQSWCRLSKLERSPEKTMPKFVGSVMEKLFACSQVVGPVLLGGPGRKEALQINPIEIFNRDKFDNKADTKTVLDSCFSDGEYAVGDSVDDWFGNRFSGGDDSVGFIRARLKNVKKDIGGVYDELEYTIIVKDGLACNICVFPVEIPSDRIKNVADAAMRLNQLLNCSLFCVDFENKKLWCRFSIPVSSFIDDLGTKEMNYNVVELIINAVAEVAKNSELFSTIMAEGKIK